MIMYLNTFSIAFMTMCRYTVKKHFNHEDPMKRIIFIITLLMAIPARADFWDDVADGVVHVALAANSACIADRVERINRQLDEVAYQMSRVSSQTASYHYYHFRSLDDVIVSMRRAWVPFTRDYNRFYPLIINDLDYLSTVLDDIINDLSRMRLSFMYDYRYDLDAIGNALRNAHTPFHDRYPAAWSPYTIRRIADDFSQAERVLRRMR